MLCHNVIAPKFKPIAKIHAYNDKGQSIPWVRVNRVPDFVHFSHQAHLAQEIDCGHCHGNVREMDRTNEANVFRMSFCVDCHNERKLSVDCYRRHY